MSVRGGILTAFYLVAALGCTAFLAFMMTGVVAHWRLPIQEDFQIHIMKNDTISGVSNHLFQQNRIHHSLFLEAVYVVNSKSENVSPGMYTVAYGMTYFDLVKMLQAEYED